MLQRHAFATATLLALSFFAIVIDPAAPFAWADDKAAEKQQPPAKERTMAEKLTDQAPVSFVDTPLSEVVEFLAQRHKVPIVIDANALKAADVEPGVKVNLSLELITLQNALTTILKPLKLDWTIANEVVLITTAERAAAERDVRLYPVTELVALGFAQKDDNSGRGDLRDAICIAVSPETWKEANGDGTISWFESQLVVRQSRAVHQQVEELLTDLKAAFAGGSPRRSLPAEARIESQLEYPTTLSFTDTTLREAVEYISQLHRLPFVFDEVAIKAGKVDLDGQLVSANLEKIKLASALNLILEPNKLSYVVEGEILKVTMLVEAEQTMLTRIYYAKGLTSDEFTTKQLADVIVDATGPENWAGEQEVVKGTIAALPDCVVVRQSSRVHREIAGLLQKLQGRNKGGTTDISGAIGAPPKKPSKP